MERAPLSSSSSKRKPLSDRTNFLVPTSVILRKLSSSLATAPPPLPTSFPKHKPNAIPNPKSYKSSAKELDTNSSKSDTSIGSSNYNANFPNPSIIPSTPPRVSVTNPDNVREEVFEPLVIYDRRQTAEKIKDKGKAVAVPFTCPPIKKANNNGKAVSLPISYPSLVNAKNKRKAIAVPFTCPPTARTRKIRNQHNEAGDMGLSKSHTVPPPKNKKKRCHSKDTLPPEFIEQQRAYFKEVDEFELAEEVVSENEEDKEEKKWYIQDKVGGNPNQ
ncbi:hypothetical protein U1Q18_026331 [Sarracenia purpurea var. burkii]